MINFDTIATLIKWGLVLGAFIGLYQIVALGRIWLYSKKQVDLMGQILHEIQKLSRSEKRLIN